MAGCAVVLARAQDSIRRCVEEETIFEAEVVYNDREMRLACVVTRSMGDSLNPGGDSESIDFRPKIPTACARGRRSCADSLSSGSVLAWYTHSRMSVAFHKLLDSAIAMSISRA